MPMFFSQMDFRIDFFSGAKRLLKIILSIHSFVRYVSYLAIEPWSTCVGLVLYRVDYDFYYWAKQWQSKIIVWLLVQIEEWFWNGPALFFCLDKLEQHINKKHKSGFDCDQCDKKVGGSLMTHVKEWTYHRLLQLFFLARSHLFRLLYPFAMPCGISIW